MRFRRTRGLGHMPIPPVTLLLGQQRTVRGLCVELVGGPLQIPALNALELDFCGCD